MQIGILKNIIPLFFSAICLFPTLSFADCSVWDDAVVDQVSKRQHAHPDLIQSATIPVYGRPSDAIGGHGASGVEKVCLNVPAGYGVVGLYCGAALEGSGPLVGCLQGKECTIGHVQVTNVTPGPSGQICAVFVNSRENQTVNVGIVVRTSARR